MYRTRGEHVIGGLKGIVVALFLWLLVIEDEGGSALFVMTRPFALSLFWTIILTTIVQAAILGSLVSGLIGLIVGTIGWKDNVSFFDDDMATPNAWSGVRATMIVPSAAVTHTAWLEMATFTVFLITFILSIAATPFSSVSLVFAYSLWLIQAFACSRLLWTSRADVGIDGVYIRRIRRFVAFRAGDVVVNRPWGFEVWRDDDLVVRLRLRVRERFARAAIGDMLAFAMKRLENGDEARAQAAAIRALLADTAQPTPGYRVADVLPDDQDELHQLLEMSADPKLREAQEKLAKKLILPR